MKNRAGDYLILDKATGVYRENPEQAVRDDVEKHYWLHVGRTVMKDWRHYGLTPEALLSLLQALPRPALTDLELQILRRFAARIPPELAPDDYTPEIRWPWQ